MNNLLLPPLFYLPEYKTDNFFGIQTAYRVLKIECSESKLFVLTLAKQTEEHARIWESLSEAKKKEFCQLMPFTHPYSKKEGRGSDGSQIIHFPDQSFRLTHPQQQAHQAVIYDIKSHEGKTFALEKTGSEGKLVQPSPRTREILTPYFQLKEDLEMHQLQVMQSWWNRALWNVLGFPVMMPLSISREGLWQVVPKRKRLEDFNCDALAVMLNQLLALQAYTSLALTSLSWTNFKLHLGEVDGKVVFYSEVGAPSFREPCEWIDDIKRDNPELFKKLQFPLTHSLKQHLVAFYQKIKGSTLDVENEIFRLQILKRLVAHPQETTSLKAICSRRVMVRCFEEIEYFKTLFSSQPSTAITDALPDGFCESIHLPRGEVRLWDIALIISAWMQAGKWGEKEANEQFQAYLANTIQGVFNFNYKKYFNC